MKHINRHIIYYTLIGLLGFVAFSKTSELEVVKKDLELTQDALKTYEKRFEKTNDMWDLIEEFEYYPQDVGEVDYKLSKVLPTLLDDKYAKIVSPDEMDSEFTTNGDRFGFDFVEDSGKQIVWSVEEDSSADKAGLKVGDVVIAINNESVSSKTREEAYIELLKNRHVSIDVLRPDGNQERLTMEKEAVYKPAIEVDKLSDQTALVKIRVFSLGSFTHFYSQLKTLKSQGYENLVFDLRDNPGGSLNDLESMLSLLVTDKTLYLKRDKSGHVVGIPSKKNWEPVEFNLAILINRKTASSSEIFTSSLRKNIGALVIGETSYGKGIAQSMIKKSSADFDDYVKLTTHEVYSSEDERYHGKGLVPDIQVESRPYITPETDEALIEALKALSKIKN